jgi:hypothetical protein
VDRKGDLVKAETQTDSIAYSQIGAIESVGDRIALENPEMTLNRERTPRSIF